MPTTLTWNAAADVSAVGTSDGNDQAASAASPMLSQNIRSDVFGSEIDSGWTQSLQAGVAVTETGGALTIAVTSGTDRTGSSFLANLFEVPSGTDFSVDFDMTSYAGTLGGGEFAYHVGGMYTSNYAKYVVGQVDAADTSLYAWYKITSDIQIGSKVDTAVAPIFRVTLTGTTTEVLYNIGSGFVSFGTAEFEVNAYRSRITISVTNVDSGDGVQGVWDSVVQNSGGVYWTSAVHTLINKTFNQGNIDWSTFAATEVGTVEYDYSTDGGSTYTGTYRTKTAMQALADQLASQLQLKVRFNGGNETAAATVDDITVNVVSVNSHDSKPGSLLHRIKWLR